ncbi:MAG TPA: DUF2127 domain-containing protein [Verrucomicrobiae bacterium]|jgi:uncharacterized membrane protein (DUF2068 family)|nr:DUF2127 domain-containing protein [Verrucomicrobiae bacterium]
MNSEKTTVLESAGAETKGGAKKDHAPTLYFIAICKIAKGAALLLLAAGIYSMAGRDLQDDFDHFIEWVHFDPENRFFHNVSDFLSTVTPGNVRATALAFSLYGCFLSAGGVGLALRARWAIWLTICESAFFIPIEVFELTNRRTPRLDPSDEPQPHSHLFHNPRIGLLVVLILNILIVLYLYKNRQRLSRHHKGTE